MKYIAGIEGIPADVRAFILLLEQNVEFRERCQKQNRDSINNKVDR